MTLRGRGRGRGRGGRGFGGGGGYVKQEPFKLFPVIEEIGTTEWSGELQRHYVMDLKDVIYFSKQEPYVLLPPAVDGLLRVHKCVLDGLVSTRLLVPAAQAGSLIGKQGSTMKTIQEESNCIFSEFLHQA